MRFRYKEGVMENKESQKIEIMMKDYEILKTYSTSISPGIRYNLISIALATIGVVISGTMIAVANGKLFDLSDLVVKIVSILWVFFVPAFCIVILYVWLGEEQRMMRMGEYCKELEEKINKEFGEEILNWETFKRKKSIRYPEKLIIALFLGLSFGFFLAGLYLIKVNFIMALIIDLIVHIVIVLYTYIFVNRKIVAIENLK
jgi:hypothetical protein